jgi:hypothetical protein
MTHDVTKMLVKQSGSKLFCELIRHIQRGVYSRQKDEISLHPLYPYVRFVVLVFVRLP